jgi:hypothetical protein
VVILPFERRKLTMDQKSKERSTEETGIGHKQAEESDKQGNTMDCGNTH